MNSLQLGVIGLGSVVREIYQNLYFHSAYSSEIHIAAVCDVDQTAVSDFAEQFSIPVERCFSSYQDMIAAVELDAVAVNTPDHLHKAPVLCAFDAGLDVLLAKPLAHSIGDAHEIIARRGSSQRFLGVDFHKREDPRIREARSRFQNGDYGQFQSSVWYMLDRLMAADPNHVPRFFTSTDFASRNTPVSFLTVHMADAFISIVELEPVELKAIGYKQKLPSLRPIAVDGYDLIDTEIIFENGGVCHIISGWSLPNTAHALTVQSARLIGSEGMLDLDIDAPGYHELLADGIFERNPLFQNFESDGTVSGYGIRSPGKILQNIIRHRNGQMDQQERERLCCPSSLGFPASVVCNAAHASLERGRLCGNGVVHGSRIDIAELVATCTGKRSPD